MVSSSSTSAVVPMAPSGLCLTRDDFLGDNFSVDSFLTHFTVSHGSTVSLETLRDDLGVYLKVLRTSMIQLINEDYADFVNLSTNLVGLDSQIECLSQPLKEFRDRVESVRNSVSSALNSMHSRLKKREDIRAKKLALQNLEHIANTVLKVERLLKDRDDLSADLTERVATEVNHLNFCVSRCVNEGENSAFIQEVRPRLQVIGDRLHAALEEKFIDAITLKDEETLKRCLRIYATIDRIQDAERLVRTRIVGPFLDEILTESSLHSDPLGLKGVYSRVLQTTNRLELLNKLTRQTGSKGYHFLIHSFWADFVDKIEDNLAFIFSAGNPDTFFVNYHTSLEFLNEFEKTILLHDDNLELAEFRRGTNFSNFLNRWNLPVYFQIRFQEIALPLERALTEEEIYKYQENEPRYFRLEVSQAVLEALRRCWNTDIYIHSLIHRFWKLTLQILSRYATAIQGIVDRSSEYKKKEANNNNKQEGGHKEGEKGVVEEEEEQGREVVQNEEDKKKNVKPNNLKFLISLRFDISDMIDRYVPEIFESAEKNQLSHLDEDLRRQLKSTLEESFDLLKGKFDDISRIVVNEIVSECLPYLKQVSDIPRLYRRTNREVPSKPCPYINSILTPVDNFYREYRDLASDTVFRNWLISIFSQISNQYFINVSEVLEAVYKMEESLKRLKRIREKSDKGQKANQISQVSDDDKIRLQIRIDIRKFVEKINEMEIKVSEIDDLEELQRRIEDVTKSISVEK